MGGHNSTLNTLETNVRHLEAENRELRKQLNSLKNINQMQESQLNEKQQLIPDIDTKKIKKKITEVSKEKINHYVEKLLENSDTNISYLPDFVEKKIYTNILGIALNLLNDILETTSIKFIGHEIALDLREDSTELVNESK